jgi:tetratricopeptide (TPR) repeat protein
MCFDTARVWLESAITSTTVDYRLPLSLGICEAGLGNRERALEAANHAANMMSLSVDAVDGAYPLVAIAQVRILLGDYESAVESIESLLKLDAPKLLTVPLLRLDPIYDPLRSNLRFQALLTKYDDR